MVILSLIQYNFFYYFSLLFFVTLVERQFLINFYYVKFLVKHNILLATRSFQKRSIQARPQGGAIGAKPPQNFCLPPQNFSGLKFQWLMI